MDDAPDGHAQPHPPVVDGEPWQHFQALPWSIPVPISAGLWQSQARQLLQNAWLPATLDYPLPYFWLCILGLESIGDLDKGIGRP